MPTVLRPAAPRRVPAAWVFPGLGAGLDRRLHGVAAPVRYGPWSHYGRDRRGMMADKIWSYLSEQTKDRLRVVADGRHVAMAEAAALLVMEALEPRPEGGSTTAGGAAPPGPPAAPNLFPRHERK